MATDYARIKAENEKRYGTDIGRIGPMLLSDRYDDRSHFIFELLQNAEDALARRAGWSGSRTVSFELTKRALRVSHFGAPFSEADVRGICGIAQSAKDVTAIGRFGIGFKSVYAFTSRPEVHSGEEHFAIENFVWPLAIEPSGIQGEQTVFSLPLKESDTSASVEIQAGLQKLNPRVLLFLREISDITWQVEGGPAGAYTRSQPEPIGDLARRVVVSRKGTQKAFEESWLIFSREVRDPSGQPRGRVEIAFCLAKSEKTLSVQPLSDTDLVVFFPTVVPTHLGFLVQGPFRTTPSRDNVARRDPWNLHLVQETATLLVAALRGLRDLGVLDVGVLRGMPLDRAKFEEGQMFAQLFSAVREVLLVEPLLPKFGGGYTSAKRARIAGTRGLRELITPAQLTDLSSEDGEISWLTEEVTQDRSQLLRQYAVRELGIADVSPESLIPMLRRQFLEKQGDDWIQRLYEFLSGQSALIRWGNLQDVPLVRLEDGRHVCAREAFLPSAFETDFPTVRRAVLSTSASRSLLAQLGMTEPDQVDDIIGHVLPRFSSTDGYSEASYEADVQRIIAAFGSDSESRRQRLLAALSDCRFVKTVNAENGSRRFAKPGETYQASDRLTQLFQGVPDVLLVDSACSCLRGEKAREMLEAAGVARILRPTRSSSRFSNEELAGLRRRAGCENSTGDHPVEDYTLLGLDGLLALLPKLAADDRERRARLLWEALEDLHERRGAGAFFGTYRWYYYRARHCDFDAAFVDRLNDAAWVPDRVGNLKRPSELVFKGTGWNENPFLLSKIRFQPPVMETLAAEAGMEPEMLHLLKKLGVTTAAALKQRLGLAESSSLAHPKPKPDEVSDAVEKILGGDSNPTPPIPDPTLTDPIEKRDAGSIPRAGGVSQASASQRDGNGDRPDPHRKPPDGPGTGPTQPKATSESPGGARPFISYLGAQPEEEDSDPDGLAHDARLALEEKAIALILAREPDLRRTPTHNPGFDLAGFRGEDSQTKWVEVKAMTGTIHDRPVGLSRAQFDCAKEHGESYWLYIVERANDAMARIIRIRNPAGRTRTFTFDHGWLCIANLDVQDDRKD